MEKNFDKWNIKKKGLDTSTHEPPLVSEGDLWWCATGENIGVETSGKGRDFTRPVVVLKKIRENFFSWHSHNYAQAKRQLVCRF